MDPLAQANSFSFDGIGHLEGPHGDLSNPLEKDNANKVPLGLPKSVEG